MKRKLLIPIVIVALGCWLSGLAAADMITFNLTRGNSALINGGNNPDYLTVLISVPNGGGAATFTLTALDSYKFGGNEGFDVDFSTAVNISGLPSGWSAASGQDRQVDGWGRFDEIIEQSNNNSPVTSLTFTATPTSGSFANAFAVLVANSSGNLAAAHISPATGDTGYAANGDPVVVPLPGALLLLGAGLVRLGAYGRRRIRA